MTAKRSDHISAKLCSELSQGVQDRPAPQNISACSDTGLRTKIGPYPVEKFAYVLRLLAVSREQIEEEQEVDPKFILTHAYSVQRLRDAQECIGRHLFGSPVLVRYRFPKLPDLYLVENEGHGIVAARLAERKTITALVKSGFDCKADSAEIRGQSVCIRDAGDEFSSKKVEQDVIDILLALGVVDRTPTPWKIIQRVLGWLAR